MFVRKVNHCILISIPAPARGRTASMRFPLVLVTFQFPPPRGGELNRPPAPVVQFNFNSRPREGAKHHRHGSGATANFNSRPREGAKSSVTSQKRSEYISIPAPARGRTGRGISSTGSIVFQFPPPRGGELCRIALDHPQEISIPAPARGRSIALRMLRPLRNFNSRPREGAKRSPRGAGPIEFDFNSRPREGAKAKLHKIEQSILSVC